VPLSALADPEGARLSLAETTARRMLTLRMYSLPGVSAVLKDTCAFGLSVSLFRFYLLSTLTCSPIPRPSPRSRSPTFASSRPLLTACSFPSFHVFSSGVISYILKYTVISSIHLACFSCFLMSSYGLFPLPFLILFQSTSLRGPAIVGVCEEFFPPAVQLG